MNRLAGGFEDPLDMIFHITPRPRRRQDHFRLIRVSAAPLDLVLFPCAP
ncbi:MAG TPA: hypothetical protein VI504_10705 [Candidatus Eisenbacteria bacterium]